MSEGFYRLTSDPFRLLPDPDICYPHSSHIKVWDCVKRALAKGNGITVVTGAPGSGKTTLAERLFAAFETGPAITQRVVAHPMTNADWLARLSFALGLTVETVDEVLLARRLENYVTELGRSRRRVLIIIDEAQTLSSNSLEAMLKLTQLGSGQRTTIQFVLLGSSEMESKFSGCLVTAGPPPEIEHHRLMPMSLSETKAYLEYRLSFAGWQGLPRFEGSCVLAIYRHSAGLPRVINKIGSRLIVFGDIDRKPQLTGVDVQQIAKGFTDESINPFGAVSDQPVPAENDLGSDYRYLALVPPTLRRDYPSVEYPAGSAYLEVIGARTETRGQKGLARQAGKGQALDPVVVEMLRSSSRFTSPTPELESVSNRQRHLDLKHRFPSTSLVLGLLILGGLVIAFGNAVVTLNSTDEEPSVSSYELEKLNQERETASNAVLVPTPTSKLFQPTASANPTSSIDQPAWSFMASEPINSLPVVTSPIRDLQVSTAGIFAHALENEDTTTEPQLNDGQNSVAIEDSPSEEASIDDLLRLAEEAFVEHRLLSPESDNAYLYYMQALKRDKGNRQALNGLNQIVSRYIWWAEQDYKKGDYRRSGIFVDRALTISPGDVDAMAMRQRIIKAVAAKSSRISNKGHHSSNSTEMDDFRSTKRDQNFQHYWEMLDMP